jgi:UDP-GlcNAc3NAcA epimerase
MDARNLSSYRIAHVVGARPQFVKLKPLVEAIQRLGGVNWVAHTGQHYDSHMNASFWDELGVVPDYHGTWIERNADLRALAAALREAQVHAVVVYGDTDSTVLGAQAALELGIPFAHAEAGLRSFNDAMPEERNRVWVDRRALWLWAPTEVAMDHIRRENLDRGAPWVVNTGDLMFDAFPKHPWSQLQSSTVLVTIHRNTNVDDPERIRRIEAALDGLVGDFHVLWPRHPRHRAAGLHSVRVPDCAPLSRPEIVDALYRTEFIITDSGGLQKEAFFAGRRAIVLRDETEWTELVDSGWTSLISPDSTDLEAAIRAQFGRWAQIGHSEPPKLYGDGCAADAMAVSLAQGLRELSQS